MKLISESSVGDIPDVDGREEGLKDLNISEEAIFSFWASEISY